MLKKSAKQLRNCLKPFLFFFFALIFLGVLLKDKAMDFHHRYRENWKVKTLAEGYLRSNGLDTQKYYVGAAVAESNGVWSVVIVQGGDESLFRGKTVVASSDILLRVNLNDDSVIPIGPGGGGCPSQN